MKKRDPRLEGWEERIRERYKSNRRNVDWESVSDLEDTIVPGLYNWAHSLAIETLHEASLFKGMIESMGMSGVIHLMKDTPEGRNDIMVIAVTLL